MLVESEEREGIRKDGRKRRGPKRGEKRKVN